MRIVLGNHHAITRDEGRNKVELKRAKRATEVDIPDEWTPTQIFRALTDPDGIIFHHFDEGKSPAWIATEDENLSTFLSIALGVDEVRTLED